jgi:hypothetical protein
VHLTTATKWHILASDLGPAISLQSIAPALTSVRVGTSTRTHRDLEKD